jgi:hypothetical protein
MTDIFPYYDYDTSSVSGESNTSEDDNLNDYKIDSNGQFYISIPNGNGSIKLYHPSNDDDPIHISYNDNSYTSIIYNDMYDIIYHNYGYQVGYIYWPESIIVFPEYI